MKHYFKVVLTSFKYFKSRKFTFLFGKSYPERSPSSKTGFEITFFVLRIKTFSQKDEKTGSEALPRDNLKIHTSLFCPKSINLPFRQIQKDAKATIILVLFLYCHDIPWLDKKSVDANNGQGKCRRAPRNFIGQGRFSGARAQFLFFFK